jgi:hypothetical protein
VSTVHSRGLRISVQVHPRALAGREDEAGGAYTTFWSLKIKRISSKALPTDLGRTPMR